MNTNNIRPNTESKLVFDERRNQLVNTRSMSELQMRSLQRSFRIFRPDLSTHDEHKFMQQLNIGESYLDYMKHKLNREIQRMCMQTPPAMRKQKSMLYESAMLQLGHPFTRGSRVGCNRTWQEACSLVNYIDLIRNRVSKYALTFPLLNRNLNKQQCLQKEQEVAQLLFQEMIKPPHVTQ